MTSTPGSAGPTAATTPPRSDPAGRVHRFARPVRLVHRTTAALMLLCVASAACLYVPQLAQLVGRRRLV
ncbi:cytochrome b/b6 domain-containing protein, partial [Streptomyces sp. DT225]